MLPISLIFDTSQPFARGALRGIEHFAQARPQWGLLFHDSHNLSHRALREMRPAGIIAHVVNPSLAKVLESQADFVVNTSFMCPEAPFPRVTVDNCEVGRIGFRHLQERGFRNFGLVGHSSHRYSLERESGFCEGLDRLLHTYSGFYRRRDHDGSAPGAPLDGTSNLKRWLQRLPKPVGILTCRGVWGVQVVEACRLVNLRVPDDVGVVCVDDDDLLCELSRPSLSSILVPSERIGFEAASLLDRLLPSRVHNGSHHARHSSAVRPSKTAVRRPDSDALRVPPTRFIARQSSDVYAAGSRELSAAVRYIRNHAHERIHVDDVAREVGMSRRALECEFRDALQRGIGEEIRRVRLTRAEHFLTSTELSVSEIAAQAGFASVYYLCRFFRQQTGVTPTEFRKRRTRVGR
jgi:LacI family transcriptional regulator